jgi:hypothetical protein
VIAAGVDLIGQGVGLAVVEVEHDVAGAGRRTAEQAAQLVHRLVVEGDVADTATVGL